ncbi:hypothetical protein [Staphylococcus epidermidis]|nr:hypothetical protein [Staphylococcus epidermidis]
MGETPKLFQEAKDDESGTLSNKLFISNSNKPGMKVSLRLSY